MKISKAAIRTLVLVMIAFALGYLAGWWPQNRELGLCRGDLEQLFKRGVALQTQYNLCRQELERRQQK